MFGFFKTKSVPPSHMHILYVYFKIASRVIVQASFCLFNLPLGDMVDADLLKFNRQ